MDETQVPVTQRRSVCISTTVQKDEAGMLAFVSVRTGLLDDQQEAARKR